MFGNDEENIFFLKKVTDKNIMHFILLNEINFTSKNLYSAFCSENVELFFFNYFSRSY